MNTQKKQTTTVWNIGYQHHTQDGFVRVLANNQIGLLVDLRSKPYSRISGFNQDALKLRLAREGIDYAWMGDELGGLGCTPGQWEQGCVQLVELARKKRVAMMCMESDVNQCHRKELADILAFLHGVRNVNL